MLQNEALADFLKDEIREKGPMDMASFFDHVLAHPTLGYYRRQDPFGREGDFVTSPEISQLFGEMTGAWAADIWMQLGSPAAFDFIEVGPGRGTLMADMLRATEKVEGFHAAAQIHLVETSPVLREKQRKKLKDFEVSWHERFEEIEPGRALILVGNEFLDALPVHQLVKTKEGWAERVVTLPDDAPEKPQGMMGLMQSLAPNLLEGEQAADFEYAEQPASEGLLALVPENLPGALQGNIEGNIFEVSPQRSGFVKLVAQRIRQDNGAALFIDYGHAQPEIGNSLHAIFRHTHVDILKNPGHADLSANVDFSAVAVAAREEGIEASEAVTQGGFLKTLGIEARAAYLAKKANRKQADELAAGLKRLIEMDQMGNFLVMGIYHGQGNNEERLKPAGF